MVDVVLFELNLTFERLLLFVLAERCNLDAEFGSQQLAEDLLDRVDDLRVGAQGIAEQLLGLAPEPRFTGHGFEDLWLERRLSRGSSPLRRRSDAVQRSSSRSAWSLGNGARSG